MLYLCWQNDNSVLGVATSEEKAKKVCSSIGDSYMPIQENCAQREYVETTPMCIYHTRDGFLTYEESLEKGYTFK